MKKLLKIKRSEEPHWVGDGFPTRTVFHYGDLAKEVSPFLLLDYAGPVEFPPTKESLGVGEYFGFEIDGDEYDGTSMNCTYEDADREVVFPVETISGSSRPRAPVRAK